MGIILLHLKLLAEHKFRIIWIVTFLSTIVKTDGVLRAVSVQPLEAVRLTHNAQLRCGFQGERLHIQYITWTKHFTGGGQAFVYGYDACAGESTGYGDLENRAVLDIAKPTEIQTDLNSTTSGESVVIGSATLTITSVRLEDEARYECLVKCLGGPAETNSQLLTVVVLPHEPELVLPSNIKENDAINITCHAQLGRPTGRIDWLLKMPNENQYQTLSRNQSDTILDHHANGTTSGTSVLLLSVTSQYHGALLRCQLESRSMKPWEKRPSAEQTLYIPFSPREGRILFDPFTNTLSCTAKSNPHPTYLWTWLFDDKMSTILTTRSSLDVSSIRRPGAYRFRCLASNVIDGIRHTIAVDTVHSITVDSIGTSTTTTTTAKTPSVDGQIINHIQPLTTTPAEGSKFQVKEGHPLTIDDPFVWANDVPRPAYEQEVVHIWDVVVSQYGDSIGASNEAEDLVNYGTNDEEVNLNDSDDKDIKSEESMDQIELKSSENWSSASKNMIPQENNNANNWDSTDGTVATDTSGAISTNPQNNEKPIEKESDDFDAFNYIPFLESHIDELSPHNYDYYDVSRKYIVSAEDNQIDVRDKSTSIETVTPLLTSTSSEAVTEAPKSTEQNIEIDAVPNKQTIGQDTEKSIEKKITSRSPSHDLEDKEDDYEDDYEAEFKIYLRDLLNPRLDTSILMDDNRNIGRVVPLNKNGHLNFAKLSSKLPFSTKNMLRKRIPLMSKNLKIILGYYKDKLEQSLSEEGMESNARQLPPFLDRFNYDVYDPVSPNPAPLDPFYQLLVESPTVPLTNAGSYNKIYRKMPSNNQPQYPYSSDAKLGLKPPSLMGSYGKRLQAPIPQDGTMKNLGPFINPANFLTPRKEQMDLAHDFDTNPEIPMNTFPNEFGQWDEQHVHFPGSNSDKDFDGMYSQLKRPEDFNNYFVNQPIPKHSFTPYEPRLAQNSNDGHVNKYGIYEVESKLQNNPGGINNQPEIYPQPIQINPVPIREIVNNHKVFHSDNKQTPNGLSVTSPKNDNNDFRKYQRQSLDIVHDDKILPYMADDFLPEVDQISAHDVKDLLALDVKGPLDYSDDYETVSLTTKKEYDCQSRTSGAYGGGCRSFYRCKNGQTYRVECKAPYVFNSKSQQCDKASKVPAPCGEWQDCATKPNGKYAVKSRQCRFYYTCFQGMFLGHNECNPGTVFNEEQQVCDWEDKVGEICVPK